MMAKSSTQFVDRVGVQPYEDMFAPWKAEIGPARQREHPDLHGLGQDCASTSSNAAKASARSNARVCQGCPFNRRICAVAIP